MIQPAGQPVAELNFGVSNDPLDAAEGNTPGFLESLDRLALLRADGPTVAAYDFNYLRQKLQAGASE